MLSAVRWKPTVYVKPHEYVVSTGGELHPQLILIMQSQIAEHGYSKRFRKYTFRYWDHGGYKYWMMPQPVPVTIEMLRSTGYVLNRERIEE